MFKGKERRDKEKHVCDMQHFKAICIYKRILLMASRRIIYTKNLEKKEIFLSFLFFFFWRKFKKARDR